jgi:long-chain acyl-CoA synthetase
MLHQAALTYPEVAYLVRKGDGGWQPTSFRQAEEQATAFASALLKHGCRKGQTLAILSEGSPQWVVGELGILLAGCIAVPLSIRLLPEELAFRLNHAGCRAILVSRNYLEKVSAVLDRLETRPFTLIYLDDDGGDMEALAGARGLRPGRDILGFAAMVSEGREHLPVSEPTLRAIESGTEEDDVVTISYTSGTTGNPKGIMLTHRNYFANSTDSVVMHEVPDGYTMLVVLPIDHSFTHTVGIYCGLLRGLTLYFVDARGGGMAILRNIPINLKETEPVFLLTVPALSGNFMKKIQAAIEEKGGLARSLFRLGLRAGKRIHGDCWRRPPLLARALNALPYFLVDRLVFRKVRATFGRKIRFFVGGGALLDVRQQEFFWAIGIPIYQGYGQTEAAPVISSNTPRATRLGTSGRLAPSVRCRIVRLDGVEAAPGELGEIVVAGESVMKGYYRNEQATAEALRDGWLHTGDLGYLDADGFLVVAGREKALLIAEDGEKYSPEEIEEAILSSAPLIAQVMLYNYHRRFTSALVVLDGERVHRLLAAGKIDGTRALLEEVRRSFFRFREDPRCNFPSRWIPHTFQLLAEPFSEANGMINSTLKMVRYRITGAYADLLDYVYTPEGESYDNPRNRQTAARLFGLQEEPVEVSL